MNLMDEQIKIIDEFYAKVHQYIDAQVKIKVDEILKKNEIVEKESILFNHLWDDIFTQVKEDSLKEELKLNKWDEVRGEKVFKRLEEMGLSHKDMMKFKKSKIPNYIIAKMLNVSVKTVSGYYKNYSEGEK